MNVAAALERPIPSVPPAKAHHIDTDRLVMRPVQLSDFEHFLGILTNKAVMKFIGLEQGRIPSVNEVKAHVQRAVGVWRTRGYGRWSVFDRQSGEFAGFCGFRSEAGMPELVVVMHEAYWGDSYATEAASAVLEYGFDHLGFTEVCSFTRPENERARMLLDRLGAEYRGIVDYHGVEGAAYAITAEYQRF